MGVTKVLQMKDSKLQTAKALHALILQHPRRTRHELHVLLQKTGAPASEHLTEGVLRYMQRWSLVYCFRADRAGRYDVKPNLLTYQTQFRTWEEAARHLPRPKPLMLSGDYLANPDNHPGIPL